MKIVRGFHNLTKRKQDRVVTIGNFDGMHLGHQRLIQRVEEIARQKQASSLIMIFEPQPEEYFFQDNVPARLMSLRDKLNFLCCTHIEEVLIISFNKDFAERTASRFVQEIIVEQLKAEILVLGEDFCFGKNRQGNVTYLQEIQHQYNFTTEVFESVYDGLDGQQRRISSSRIREFLSQGDIKTAEKLLGHAFSLSGKVEHGDKRGRVLNFPTANIYLHRKKSPLMGVFVVEVAGIEKHSIPGIANIGLRPTIGGACLLLEVHLFGFNKDIYGHRVEVKFIKKLRDERKFHTLALLKEQIEQDVQQAKNFFV